MSTLRSIVGPDYPLGLASFPYVDYHPALPYSVFLGPNGAQYNVPQLYWKDIGTTVDTGYIHTWVWNRIYRRPIDPLGQVYSRPKAGQIRRFRAPRPLTRLRRRQLVGLAGGAQAAVEGDQRRRSRPRPRLPTRATLPASRLEGRLRRLGAAAARGRRLPDRDQRLLPVGDAGDRLPVPGSPRPARRRATSTCRPGTLCCSTSRCRSPGPRGGAVAAARGALTRDSRPEAAALREAAGRALRDPPAQATLDSFPVRSRPQAR